MQYDELTFEQGMERLEQIAQQLEKGNLPLADMVALYEDGVALSKHCMALLDTYDAKLETLWREGRQQEQ